MKYYYTIQFSKLFQSIYNNISLNKKYFLHETKLEKIFTSLIIKDDGSHIRGGWISEDSTFICDKYVNEYFVVTKHFIK